MNAPTQPNENVQVQPPTTSDDSATGNVTPPLFEDEDNGNEVGFSQDVNVASGGRVSAVLASGDSSFAVLEDGSLWAWGINSVGIWGGMLGDGTTINRERPVWIMDDVVSVFHGTLHGLAIRKDGSLWGWGFNGNMFEGLTIEPVEGRIGDGTTIDRLTPVFILDDVVSVSAGVSHSLAVRSDGSLWAWGSGRIGDGTTDSHLAPVRIMDNVVAVSAGLNHSLAIRADGSLYAWGNNNLGQLGTGNTTFYSSPVRIKNNVIAILAGNSRSLAITSDGGLWAWGSNLMGMPGGSVWEANDLTSPARIMDDVADVFFGSYAMYVLRSDRSLWAWGDNFVGQLGDGSGTRQQNPVKIMDNVVSFSAGHAHALAITNDGNVLAWGWNEHGQLGDGTTTNRTTPFRITEHILN